MRIDDLRGWFGTYLIKDVELRITGFIGNAASVSCPHSGVLVAAPTTGRRPKTARALRDVMTRTARLKDPRVKPVGGA